jgi:hypothetical protein
MRDGFLSEAVLSGFVAIVPHPVELTTQVVCVISVLWVPEAGYGTLGRLYGETATLALMRTVVFEVEKNAFPYVKRLRRLWRAGLKRGFSEC